jgi:anti-sigma regulatory factor (Ser/Thr protein kinase)
MPNNTTRPTRDTDPAANPAPCPWPSLTVPLAPGDTAALTHLRALALRTLLSWNTGEEQADEILVVLSELATNALIHTDGPAQVQLTWHATQIRLDVTDTSTEEPDQRTGPTDGERGYGLALIAAALADEITCIPRGDGKTIRAHFDRAAECPTTGPLAADQPRPLLSTK